jgi:DNA-binding NtrC family response regulator
MAESGQIRLDLSLTPDLASTFTTAARLAKAYLSTVVILGETGVGKTEIARHIHATSPRAEMPFEIIDLSQATASLFEDELYGHVSGAYTGSRGARISRLQRAEGGTVFLDEIGTLPFELQSRLLRLVQERKFSPLGSDKVIEINVRFIVATSRNLREMTGKGEFREDLYYRLNNLQIIVPPLRERKNDIIPLAEHFLKQASILDRVPQKKLSENAKAVLIEYDWPGNLRELQNEMIHATVMAEGAMIEAYDMSFVNKPCSPAQDFNHTESISQISQLKEFPKIDRLYAICMRYVIGKALEENDSSKEKTARFLGINVNTLTGKISSNFYISQTTLTEIRTAVEEWNKIKGDIPELPFIAEMVRVVIEGRDTSTNIIDEIDKIFYQAKIFALRQSLIENDFVQTHVATAVKIHPTTVTKFIRENQDLREWVDAKRLKKNQLERPMEVS